MAGIRVLHSASTNPYFNLAVEDVIFRSMSTEQRLLFLWRNADTVVIGRAQNPWKECNTRKMEEDGVKLVRRQSGGGAVFQDLGNTNFTFMAGKPEYDKSVSTTIVLDALKTLGIHGKATGRNDLVVEHDGADRKFSGSAYREKSDRGFHHGTVLIDANLQRLANYLNPDPKKLQSKGFDSVRSRVANLCELVPSLTHTAVCGAITEAFFAYHNERVELEFISPESVPDLPGFEERFKLQSSWNWNFGSSPQFMHTLEERFEWGGVEIHLDVKKGDIEAAQIYTDSLDPAPLEAIQEQLLGVAYTGDAVAAAIADVMSRFPADAQHTSELTSWVKRELA